MPKMLKSRKLGTKPKNKTTARLGRNLLLRYRLSKNHRDLLSPAFATSYAKYRALYSFASEKKGLCRTSVGCFCEYGHLFMSFTIIILLPRLNLVCLIHKSFYPAISIPILPSRCGGHNLQRLCTAFLLLRGCCRRQTLRLFRSPLALNSGGGGQLPGSYIAFLLLRGCCRRQTLG